MEKIYREEDCGTKKKIEAVLQTKWLARRLFCYPQVTSTNTVAKSKMQECGINGLLVVADEQTAGKGRRGRCWQSPPGQAIYMTLALQPTFSPDKASMLTLVMAYAVAQAIAAVTGLEVSIKWPNDVVVNKKKVCGILTEMSAGKEGIESVVIGTGINVNQQEFPLELADTATSLFMETGHPVDRERLIAKTMDYFETAYELFLEKENLAFMQEQYNGMLANYNREVAVLEPQGKYEGVAEGINEHGELLVRKADGVLVKVYAGEVSVRGIYGYV